jgi:hypothetical protein
MKKKKKAINPSSVGKQKSKKLHPTTDGVLIKFK